MRAKISKICDLVSDRSGNFAMISAIVLPILIGSVGVALDTSRMFTAKQKLLVAADAGAVAAAAALADGLTMSVAEAEEYALNFAKAQLGSEATDLKLNCTSVDFEESTANGGGTTYDVTVDLCMDVHLTGFSAVLGFAEPTINVTAEAESSTGAKSAMSMYLVLDRSGSMGWAISQERVRKTYSYRCGWNRTCTRTYWGYRTKMDALKDAVDALTIQIDEADPDQNFTRLAAVSYNHYMQASSRFDWGTERASEYVHALEATGGTDSSDAMREAYRKLTETKEDQAHESKNEQVPDKYIVFMTDGDNNYSSADTATKRWCDLAKVEDIEIFTVAFLAPARGQELLQYCATDENHYFDASNAEEMIAAFEYIGSKATEKMTRLLN